MDSIFYPAYIQIINRKNNGWFHSRGDELFYLSERKIDWIDREKYFGLTKSQILKELFCRYQGKLGYYLVNLAEREYYYCGLSVDDIQEKLYELGINYRGQT